MPKPGTRVFSGLPAFTVEPGSLWAFGVAIGCVVVAVAVRWLAGIVDPQIPPFLTIFAAILITTILAGALAGIVASAAGLAMTWAAFAASIPTAFSPTSLALYALASAGIVWVSEQYRALLRRLQEKEAALERQMALVLAENAILSDIASEALLPSTLERLTRSIEEYSGGQMLASVLLLDRDGRHLRHGAAPSLPEAYNLAIDGEEIGPSVGSCGTAAYRKEPVYVTDIMSDPLWANYRGLAQAHGLRACWSTPILSKAATVLGTFALYHREPRTPQPHETEIVELAARIATIAIETQQSREHHQLLLEELTHRVKNLFTVVLSIASTTLRNRTDESSYRAFENRVIALSKTQNLLTQSHWSSVDTRELVNEIAVAPFADKQNRFQLQGPALRIPARLTLPFALSLHELCTNAAKYGALTNDRGRVLVEWGYAAADAMPRKFFMRWSESDGPPVTQPAAQGFGSRMIKNAFAADLGADATIDYKPTGLVCEIVLPLELAPSAPLQPQLS